MDDYEKNFGFQISYPTPSSDIINYPTPSSLPLQPSSAPPGLISALGLPSVAHEDACMFVYVADHVFCEITSHKTHRHGRVIHALKWKDAQAKVAIERNASRPIKCQACQATVPIGYGVALSACRHSFCRPCMVQRIKGSRRAAHVTCPCCNAALHAGEVFGLLVERAAYNAYTLRLVTEDAAIMRNAFRCRTPNCKFYVVFEDLARKSAHAKRSNAPSVTVCPICKEASCLTCEVSFFERKTQYHHSAFDRLNNFFFFSKLRT